MTKLITELTVGVSSGTIQIALNKMYAILEKYNISEEDNKEIARALRKAIVIYNDRDNKKIECVSKELSQCHKLPEE